jgi:hypothetical protein
MIFTLEESLAAPKRALWHLLVSEKANICHEPEQVFDNNLEFKVKKEGS